MNTRDEKYICDCGEIYHSLAAIESCQINHHGKPQKTLVLDKVIDRYPRMLGLLKAAELELRHHAPTHQMTVCVLCQIRTFLKEIEQ